METIPLWQIVSLTSIISWVLLSSFLNLTQKIRFLLQPLVTRCVIDGTPFILKVQGFRHDALDAFFSAISCLVSVPFYTAFLPLLFWSGHSKLARQLSLLIAFCDYLGNSVKDLVSAPRPSSPPVRRITATKDEEENAQEYGLPSSHTLNTVCLSGYLLLYMLACNSPTNHVVQLAGIVTVCFFVGLIGFGRIYLGMHSLVDIFSGLVMGLLILSFWLWVHDYIDNFIVSGQNVTSFWAALSLLLLFAYPTPELPTPSFEYHAAFNGVALGIVSGVQQTYNQFHHENVSKILNPDMSLLQFVGRMAVGIPTILIVKFCSKALAKRMLPVVCNTLGIPIRSTSYILALKDCGGSKAKCESKQMGNFQRMLLFCQESYDVDTGIRFLQYTGLAWSVVDLVPSLFSHLNL
ncbi:lipid phosphate phosphatase delta-like [Aristolochia californica]|uniref:lipid phosphate phosphatase delta-like n=1 Tax=Aristolochia californica TaxID=171875 RepID=UPI0035D5D01B